MTKEIAANNQPETENEVPRTSPIRIPRSEENQRRYGFVLIKLQDLPQIDTSALNPTQLNDLQTQIRTGRGVFIHQDTVGRIDSDTRIIPKTIKYGPRGPFLSQAQTLENYLWTQENLRQAKEREREDDRLIQVRQQLGPLFAEIFQSDRQLQQLGFSGTLPPETIITSYDFPILLPEESDRCYLSPAFINKHPELTQIIRLIRSINIPTQLPQKDELATNLIAEAKIIRAWEHTITIGQNISQQYQRPLLRPSRAFPQDGTAVTIEPNFASGEIQELEIRIGSEEIQQALVAYKQALELDKAEYIKWRQNPNRTVQNLPSLANPNDFTLLGKYETVRPNTNNRIVKDQRNLDSTYFFVGERTQARMRYDSGFIGHEGMSDDSTEYYGPSITVDSQPLKPTLFDNTIWKAEKDDHGQPKITDRTKPEQIDKIKQQIKNLVKKWTKLSVLQTSSDFLQFRT